MTRLKVIARAYLARDAATVESVLAYAPRPSTLAGPVIAPEESDVPCGRMVLFYVDPVAGIHIRAHIRKHHRCIGTGKHPRQIDDLQAIQGSGV